MNAPTPPRAIPFPKKLAGKLSAGNSSSLDNYLLNVVDAIIQ
jgi:hypothetical protein